MQAWYSKPKACHVNYSYSWFQWTFDYFYQQIDQDMVHVQIIGGHDDVKASINKLMYMYMSMIDSGTKALFAYINPFDKTINDTCNEFITRIKAFNDKMVEQLDDVVERVTDALRIQESDSEDEENVDSGLRVILIAYCNRIYMIRRAEDFPIYEKDSEEKVIADAVISENKIEKIGTPVDKSEHLRLEVLIEEEAWDDGFKPNDHFLINPIAFKNELKLLVEFMVDDSFDHTKTGLMEMGVDMLKITSELVNHPMFKPLLNETRINTIDKITRQWTTMPIAKTSDAIMRIRSKVLGNNQHLKVAGYALKCVVYREEEGKGMNGSIVLFDAYDI